MSFRGTRQREPGIWRGNFRIPDLRPTADAGMTRIIPMAAAIDSLRHPEARAKRASKDGNTCRLAAILRGPRKSAGTYG